MVDIRSDVSKPCSQHASGAFGGEAVRFPSVGRPHGAQAGHDGFQWLQPPGGDVLAAEREHIEQRQCFLGFFQRCNVLEQGSALALLGNNQRLALVSELHQRLGGLIGRSSEERATAIIRAMPQTSRQRRDASVIAVVVLGHALGLWGLHKASLGKPLQVIVPARLLAEFVTPAPPAASEAPAPTAQPRPAPAPMPRSQPAAPTLAVADAPLKTLSPIRPSPRSAPPALEGSRIVPLQPQPEAVLPAPQMPEVLVKASSPPSDSLNPAPPYPATSRHLRESGRVVVRVLIGPNAQALDVVLQRSSGFDRLDQVSIETVRGWRFDPAAYRGASETLWIQIPINFVME